MDVGGFPLGQIGGPSLKGMCFPQGKLVDLPMTWSGEYTGTSGEQEIRSAGDVRKPGEQEESRRPGEQESRRPGEQETILLQLRSSKKMLIFLTRALARLQLQLWEELLCFLSFLSFLSYLSFLGVFQHWGLL